MAETGDPDPLADEVASAVAAGFAGAVVAGGPIPVSPGAASVTVDLDGAFPLVTLVTMVAPSPDWFVGVAGLSLCDEGEWRDQAVDLVVWDAGTDSGPDFTSPNADTSPKAPISTSTVFSAPIGTATFTRL